MKKIFIILGTLIALMLAGMIVMSMMDAPVKQTLISHDLVLTTPSTAAQTQAELPSALPAEAPTQPLVTPIEAESTK